MRSLIKHLALCCALSVGGLMVAAPAAAERAAAFTLRALDNKSVSLSDFVGKVVLVNFWATWCAPCQVEMPHLQQMYADLADQGFVLLSVSVDDARSKSRVKPLIRSKGYTFPVLLDTDTKLVSQYNPSKTLPYTFIVDRNGDIAHRHQGYNPGDEKDLRKYVEELLAAGHGEAAPE